jgi:bacterial/archaeal transporter family protein
MSHRLAVTITIVCWTIWSLANKMAVHRIDAMYMQLTGFCISVITAIFCFSSLRNGEHQFSWQGVGWTMVASTAATIAYFSYLYGIKTGDVGITSALMATYPLFTFIFSVLFLAEAITVPKIIGMTCILIGIAILGH